MIIHAVTPSPVERKVNDHQRVTFEFHKVNVHQKINTGNLVGFKTFCKVGASNMVYASELYPKSLCWSSPENLIQNVFPSLRLAIMML